MTEALFRDDAYLREAAARVVAVTDAGVVLDRTVLYPTGGGQPGDSGALVLEDGSTLTVTEARKGEGAAVLHVLAEGSPAPALGAVVTAKVDWERRYRLMRTHSCLHLLCRAVDGAVTGGAVGELKGRLDFDVPDPTLDRDAIAAALAAWVAADAAITSWWIDDAEFDRRPELVRTMSVSPPRGMGRVRLVEIAGIDLQACGGTHVRSTGEIGKVTVPKIEKKGRQNRRVMIEIG
jgi:misacylated tRNA(Ala) deacylase